MPLNNILYKNESHAIIGACMEVYNELGCGFLEPVYQEALAREFLFRQIPFQREVELTISYKGDLLNKRYYPDFICFEKIMHSQARILIKIKLRGLSF